MSPRAIRAGGEPPTESLLRPAAEPATRLEAFLLRAHSGAGALAFWRSPPPGSPEPSSRAQEWLASCEEAARRWSRARAIAPQPPIDLIVSEAYAFGAPARRLTALALRMGIELAGALHRAAVFLQGENQRFSLPAFGASAQAARQDWIQRWREVSSGPSARGLEAVYQARPPEPEALVARHLRRPAALLPARAGAEETLLAALERAGSGFTPHELRVFIALHEASHLTLAFQSETFADYFGLSLAGPASREALRSLLWPGPLPNPAADIEEDSLARGGHFEYSARSILMEGHADCLAALAFGEGDPSRAAAAARVWLGVRSAFIDSDEPRFDSPAGARLTHDSREALAALIQACEAAPAHPAPWPEGGSHELARRCALAGLSRWIGALARRDRPGLVASALQRKLEELAPDPAAAPAPTPEDLAWIQSLKAPFSQHPGRAAPRLAAALALIAPLEREFGLAALPLPGSLPPPEPPKAAPELGPLLIKRAALRLGLSRPARAEGPSPSHSSPPRRSP